jgi:hypothetical protein
VHLNARCVVLYGLDLLYMLFSLVTLHDTPNASIHGDRASLAAEMQASTSSPFSPSVRHWPTGLKRFTWAET